MRDPVKFFSEADFSGHADIQNGDQEEGSQAFSGLRSARGNDDTIGPGHGPIRFRRTDRRGVNYDYRVE